MRSRRPGWSDDDLLSLEEAEDARWEAEEARRAAEWRMLTPRQRAWRLAGGLLLLAPLFAPLALIPVALNARAFGVDREKVERLMLALFIGGIALIIVVTIVATLWAKFNPRPDLRAPDRGG